MVGIYSQIWLICAGKRSSLDHFVTSRFTISVESLVIAIPLKSPSSPANNRSLGVSLLRGIHNLLDSRAKSGPEDGSLASRYSSCFGIQDPPHALQKLIGHGKTQRFDLQGKQKTQWGEKLCAWIGRRTSCLR